jgi:hypothetical protein
MGIIDVTKRLGRNAWRVPGLGQLLEADYARAFARRPANQFRGVYRTFAEAEAAIPAGHPVGYDHDAITTMYRNRMEKACQSDYAVLYWMREVLRAKPASPVFDVGGHVGVSYYGWKKYQASTPGCAGWCRRCRRWPGRHRGARERGERALAFTSDLGPAAAATMLWRRVAAVRRPRRCRSCSTRWARPRT